MQLSKKISWNINIKEWQRLDIDDRELAILYTLRKLLPISRIILSPHVISKEISGPHALSDGRTRQRR